MTASYYCYKCKETAEQSASKVCSKCGGTLIGKSIMGKGIISLVFAGLWGGLAMVLSSKDKTAFYMCFSVFAVLFCNGVWKIYTSRQLKH